MSEITNELDKVKEFANKAEAAIKADVTKVEANLTADEKLIVKSIEAEYLKAQLAVQEAAKNVETLANQYKNTVEGFAKKYGVDFTVHTWDMVKAEFKKIVAGGAFGPEL